MTSMPEVMTPQQVADYLQLAPDTIYRYIREGKLVASRLGRQYRIPKRNVELFLLATSTAGDAKPRSFSQREMEAWLKEDEIGEETSQVGQRLLDSLNASGNDADR